MLRAVTAIMGDIHSENIRLYTPPSVIIGLLLWKLKHKNDPESKVKIDYMCSQMDFYTRKVIFIQLQKFPTPPYCHCCSVTKQSDSGIAEAF